MSRPFTPDQSYYANALTRKLYEAYSQALAAGTSEAQPTFEELPHEQRVAWLTVALMADAHGDGLLAPEDDDADQS